MTPFQFLRTLGLAWLLCIASFLALASGDHDHGHDHGDTSTTSVDQALPRFAAISDLFELVGVLDGKQLTLYLDQTNDNSPVKGASLELEFAGQPLPVKTIGEGLFEATLSAVPQEGAYPISATVIAGQASDLLAGELDVHEAAHVEPGSAGPSSQAWLRNGAIALLALLAIAAVLFLFKRARQTRTRSAA